MMRSLYSGVSGLQAHQIQMDVIGNNVANINTIGYKSQRVTFSEVFSQTVQSATSASDATGLGGKNAMQVGLGVNVSTIDILMTQGSAQRTDNPFDLMIDGDGMIIVKDAEQTYFTRAAALRVDDLGNLVIPNGMKVQGWLANDTGTEIVRGQVQDIVLNSPDNLFTQPEATTNVTITGNLNLDDSYTGDDTAKAITTIMNFYDSLGNYYSMEVEFTAYPNEGNENPVKWVMNIPSNTITDTNGNSYTLGGTPTTDSVEIIFDSNGNMEQPTGLISIAGLDLLGASPSLNAEIGNDGMVYLDITGITQYNATTSLDSSVGDVNGQGTGKAAGDMLGYDIGSDGKITAYYSNGDTKLLAQIVTTTFENAAGLEKAGDNVFLATANSGDFDGIGAEAIFMSGVLEMSNVDLNSEFTNMIVTQRGFQANSKTITTSDEMLQEILSLKR
ncbi:MAG: hypothetical protein ATN33_08140 [Epulopiscium sp. Nele67-Bin001]|nr:MAG: hypothetical protein BEN18_01625 [Epulopiscium sp. Nuni2H_MBin001]OON92021.1 MAG: hypothetical protein ATN33_08140 [Epulopiscium sp. Nele67-Bin001]